MPEVFVIALPASLFAWWRTGWISMSGVIGVPLVLILSWVRRADPAGWVTAAILPVLMLLRQVEWIREHARGRRTASDDTAATEPLSTAQ
jgi:hypothetical protein